MIQHIFEYLESLQLPIFLVGGAIRQRLLNLPIDDFDFILDVPVIPLVAELARKFDCPWVILDKERDIARLICDRISLDFAPILGDLESDLACRDLSINAMAVPVKARQLLGDECFNESEIIDPQGALKDIQARCIRGLSAKNFQADPLRTLRVFRFAACLNFSIETQTLQWVSELSTGITQVASERIIYEWAKLLTSSQSVSTLQKMPFNFVHVLLGGDEEYWSQNLVRLQGLEDRLVCCLAKMSTYLSTRFADRRNSCTLLKFAVLLGLGRSSRVLEERMRSLVFSRQEIDILKSWELDINQNPHSFLSDPVRLLHFYQRHREHAQGLAVLWQVDFPEALGAAQALIQRWQDQSDVVAHPPVLLNGGDVMNNLNLKPGPRIGQYLNLIQEAQARGEVKNRDEALNYLIRLSTDDGE